MVTWVESTVWDVKTWVLPGIPKPTCHVAGQAEAWQYKTFSNSQSRERRMNPLQYDRVYGPRQIFHKCVVR